LHVASVLDDAVELDDAIEFPLVEYYIEFPTDRRLLRRPRGASSGIEQSKSIDQFDQSIRTLLVMRINQSINRLVEFPCQKKMNS
jgi:hypothetical protein